MDVLFWGDVMTIDMFTFLCVLGLSMFAILFLGVYWLEFESKKFDKLHGGKTNKITHYQYH